MPVDLFSQLVSKTLSQPQQKPGISLSSVLPLAMMAMGAGGAGVAGHTAAGIAPSITPAAGSLLGGDGAMLDGAMNVGVSPVDKLQSVPSGGSSWWRNLFG